MNTQPPAATARRSGRSTLAFAALAGATVLAAGVGGYVAQSHRQAEMPALEARSATPAPARVAGPAAPAAHDAAVTRPEPAPAEPGVAADTSAPVEAAARVEPPAPAARVRPEPVERPATRPAPRATTPPAPAAQARTTTPAAAPVPPPAPQEAPAPRTPEPAPAVEPAAQEAPAVEPATSQADAAPRRSGTRVSISETFTIPADSVVGLELETSLSSQTAQVEDRVDARVTRDVKIDGTTVIPAGSRVRGEVIRVENGGRFKERARLGIAFHSLVLPDGESIDIETEPVFREGDDVGRKAGTRIGASAAGGAIIGAIFGGEKGAAIGAAAGAGAGTAVTAAQKPSEARFRAGSIVTVRLVAPVSITLQQ